MTLDALIMGAGAFVAILPFLGFPNSWDNMLFLIAGIFIVGLGIAVRRGGWKKQASNVYAAQQTQEEREHDHVV